MPSAYDSPPNSTSLAQLRNTLNDSNDSAAAYHGDPKGWARLDEIRKGLDHTLQPGVKPTTPERSSLMSLGTPPVSTSLPQIPLMGASTQTSQPAPASTPPTQPAPASSNSAAYNADGHFDMIPLMGAKSASAVIASLIPFCL